MVNGKGILFPQEPEDRCIRSVEGSSYHFVRKMSHYMAIDVEVTGPRQGRHKMVAFGASVVNVATCEIVDGGKFLALLPLPPPGADWDTKCVDEFWTKIKVESGNKTPLEQWDTLES